MVTVHTVYDPEVYLTKMPKGTSSIQTIVEEPHLYLVALNSSSIEDQATIIPDSVSCLPDLNEPLVTESGIAAMMCYGFLLEIIQHSNLNGEHRSEECTSV